MAGEGSKGSAHLCDAFALGLVIQDFLELLIASDRMGDPVCWSA